MSNLQQHEDRLSNLENETTEQARARFAANDKKAEEKKKKEEEASGKKQ